VPVVSISTSRLRKLLPRVPEEKVLEMMPFVGLDIEGVEDGVTRVEYNPNRPDFSSDYGIIRALRGILGVEVGAPKFKLTKSRFSVFVDRKVATVRPFIFALVAKGGTIDEQTLKQLIAMQEDLHEGIGRRRVRASIGIHNLKPISFPVTYTAVGPDYSFTPLGESSPRSIKQILDSEIGRKYAHILSGCETYPIIADAKSVVLSFPPIVNGETTRVDTDTSDLLVEVTATNLVVGQDVLAVIAMTLHDAGFALGAVTIREGRTASLTPDMEPRRIVADVARINSILGLNLGSKEIIRCLQRCRLDARIKGTRLICEVPRYRTDISDSTDLSEEVAIGYGIYNFDPTFPAAPTAGSTSEFSRYLSTIREVLVGQGMQESVSFSLSSADAIYKAFDRPADDALAVEAPKSAEHEFLRDSLIPSLLHALSGNVHEEYPQRLFEIGTVFHWKSGMIEEKWVLSACVAHVNASYTEIKAAIQALMRMAFGKNTRTRPAPNAFFIHGRSAEIVIDERTVGIIGEIAPLALENLKMRVPASAFEINLSELLQR
jgi:phenylalanyl-tRNA synthetase beta chain